MCVSPDTLGWVVSPIQHPVTRLSLSVESLCTPLCDESPANISGGPGNRTGPSCFPGALTPGWVVRSGSYGLIDRNRAADNVTKVWS
jgi:hypothetical protein